MDGDERSHYRERRHTSRLGERGGELDKEKEKEEGGVVGELRGG